MMALETLCFDSKLKVQTMAVHLLSHLMAGYGLKRFKPAAFAKCIEAAAGSSNAGARTEAMNCYKAMYQWLGDATESFLKGLKPIQQEELKKEFEEIKKLPKNKKLTRSEKEAAKDAELNAVIAAEENKDIDVFEVSDAVDILGKFNNEWIGQAQALTKW
jgi:hypothetical protein